MKIACVGAGFSCAVIAREIAERTTARIDVFDARTHIGGNCYTKRDPSTGVMVHTYGPHIFHTDNSTVWDYVNKYGRFMPYENRVKAITDRGVYSMPINLLTINQFFRLTLSPNDAQAFIKNQAVQIENPQSFEEVALSLVGFEIYENFFKGYTKKQWGRDPSQIPGSVLKRLPIRYNYSDNYYNSRFQGIPVDGYESIIKNLLDHPRISVHLSQGCDRKSIKKYDYSFISAPVDEWYDFKYGKLGYRSLKFKSYVGTGDIQGNPVINYCSLNTPYTRITEHKHFSPWETHEQSVVSEEYPEEWDGSNERFYPLGLADDLLLYQKYRSLAKSEENKLYFVGRLGTYRYLDMHHVINESINLALKFAM